MNYKEETEIDLIELLHFCLLKWRQIIAFMLVFGVLMGLYGAHKQTPTVERTDEEREAAIEALKNGLTDPEVTEVYSVANLYDSYKEVYNDNIRYQEKSLYLKLEPEHVNRGTATYMISDFYDNQGVYTVESQDASNIVALYRILLTNDESMELVKSVTGWKDDNQYIRELISVSADGMSLLKITVTTGSESDCRAILSVMEDRLESVMSQVKADANHEIQMLEENYVEEYSDAVNNSRKSRNETLVNLNNTIKELPTKLTSGQKALYEEIIKQKNNDYYKPVKFSTKKVVKYVIIGMLGGAFLVLCWYIAWYVLRQRLRTKDEISDMFGAKYFGIVKVSGEKKKKLFSVVDRWLERAFDERNGVLPEADAVEMIASEVSVLVEKNGISKPYVISSSEDAAVKDVVGKLLAASGDGNNISTCDSILRSPKALKEMASADGVILVEKIHESKLSDIAREMELCKEYGIDVMGAVVVM